MSIYFESLSLVFGNIYVIIFYGLIFGSFLNVVINRIPEGKSIIKPPSACPNCHYVLNWYDNIPVLSWILLRGKCRSCKTPISIQYPLIEIFTASLLTFLYLKIGFHFELLLFAIFYFILLAISIIDFKTYAIQPEMRNCLLISAVFLLIYSYFKPSILPVTWYFGLLGGALGFGILFLLMFIGRKIYKQDAMGGGDLFILAFGGLILGVKLTLTAFILSCVVAIIAYFIPWIYSALNKKSKIKHFLNLANKYSKNIKQNEIKNNYLNSLKYQINNQLKINLENKKFDIYADLDPYLFNNSEIFKSYLHLYFRLLASDKKNEANKILTKLDLILKNNNQNEYQMCFLETINYPLLGYGNPKDNFDLFKDKCDKIKYSHLFAFISQAKFSKKVKLLEQIPEWSDIENKLKNIKENISSINDSDITYLLEANKLYQYSGYIKEQMLLAEQLKLFLPSLSKDKRIEILSNLYLVYYTDFYYKDATNTLLILQDELKNENEIPVIVIETFYTLALYQAKFYKTRLAFGPYLAIGILISQFWGTELIDCYLNIFKSILIK